MKSKLEYIWLDGYKPTQSLRSKTLVKSDFGGTLEECPMWSFDGSSTNQAEGNSSDCLLKPVRLFPDPTRERPMYLIKADSSGRFAYAGLKKAHYAILEPMQLNFVEGNPVGVKAMLELQGLCSRRVRLPLAEASETLVERMRSVFAV